MKTFTENVELLAHIALDPNDFRQSKKTRRTGFPRGKRELYWRESFAQAGVYDLTPLPTGEWLVNVADIHQEAILHHLVESVYIPSVSKEDWSAKEILQHDSIGGLSLMHKGKIIAPSMCCADLTNIDNWREAASYRASDWTMVWNGHPWLYARYEDEHIVFSDATEEDAPDLSAGRFIIPVGLLQQAVDQADQDIDLFLERFDAYMRSMAQ